MVKLCLIHLNLNIYKYMYMYICKLYIIICYACPGTPKMWYVSNFSFELFLFFLFSIVLWINVNMNLLATSNISWYIHTSSSIYIAG